MPYKLTPKGTGLKARPLFVCTEKACDKRKGLLIYIDYGHILSVTQKATEQPLKRRNQKMNCWTVTGFGIEEDNLNPSVDAQIAFIKKHLPAEYEEMIKDGEECAIYDMSNTSDYLEACRSWIDDYEDPNGYTGFGALFAMAIQENEDGFAPEYLSHEGYGVIVYKDRQPWEMTDRVKAMKTEDMSAIFKKYLDDLGTSAPIERQSVVFYG